MYKNNEIENAQAAKMQHKYGRKKKQHTQTSTHTLRHTVAQAKCMIVLSAERSVE